ncbi:uncharacterized protein PG998_014037 [Apiospora kogelbergensis]|uniref:uncharacterized protein n=1 Tax=Apiospora kogelbergensis TaxID=1337665 RepID=UPI003130766E
MKLQASCQNIDTHTLEGFAQLRICASVSRATCTVSASVESYALSVLAKLGVGWPLDATGGTRPGWTLWLQHKLEVLAT